MLIAGAGGFARQVIFALQRSNPATFPVFFQQADQVPTKLFLDRYPVLQSIEEVVNHFKEKGSEFTLGTGRPAERKRLFNLLSDHGGNPYSLFDPSAIISYHDVSFEAGLSCLANVVIEPGVQIGKGVLINLGVILTHDTYVGDFVEIGPGAKLLGKSKVGHGSLIGAGAILLPGITVGEHSRVGAGAVVTSNVPDYTTVMGVPARIKLNSR